MKELATPHVSFKRFCRKLFLIIQESSFIPSRLRVFLLKLGGVSIKGKCFIGSHVSFDSLRPDLIFIGKGCCITSGTKILSHFMSPDDDAMYYGEVNIGERVFIGMNTLIVNSVSIGNDSVIGAGSIVLKDIGEKEIWAGNPAKFIRKRKSRAESDI